MSTFKYPSEILLAFREQANRGGSIPFLPGEVADHIYGLEKQIFNPAPIDMVLFCPACGTQHVDVPKVGAPDWDSFPDPPTSETPDDEVADRVAACKKWEEDNWVNPPHRSHLCTKCGHIWRPADVPTNGVLSIKTKGKADSECLPHYWLAERIMRGGYWTKLIEMCGHWQDGSETTVTLSQDDATRTCHIKAGSKRGYGNSFVAALNEFPDDEQ